MNMKNAPGLKSFYSTVPMPCPYLKNRTERKLATDISSGDSQWWANALSRSGFRRSHTVCYIAACPGCDACISVRIRNDDFVPSKKMKKTLRLNAGLEMSVIPNVATPEQYNLFHDYLTLRHSDSEMNTMYFEEYRAMIEDTPVDCVLLELRETATSRLRGVMLADVLDDGVSAVYSFFDPKTPRNSLGTFLILKLVEFARSRGLPYVYLGYYIRECPNMAYKNRFRPLEYCLNGKWKKSLAD